MKITTVPRDEIIAKQKAIREEMNALYREAKSLPLCEENITRLQEIQDRCNALDDEFRALSAIRVDF